MYTYAEPHAYDGAHERRDKHGAYYHWYTVGVETQRGHEYGEDEYQ